MTQAAAKTYPVYGFDRNSATALLNTLLLLKSMVFAHFIDAALSFLCSGITVLICLAGAAFLPV